MWAATTLSSDGPLRFEVPERLDFRGNVLVPLDEEAVRRVAGEIGESGAEAVVVCYLFSFMNPAHELRTAEIIREMLPKVHLSVSSEILPVIREYERLSTATVNAYIMPIVQSYLAKLRDTLTAAGFLEDFYLMQSSGGIMSSEVAAKRPVYTIDSGPAAGVTAAARLGDSLGYRDVISFDMGGTTAKVCVVRDGRPEVTNRFWIGSRYFIGVAGHGHGGDRRRGREHRLHRSGRRGPRRTAQRGGRARARLLPEGRHRTHGHRRRPGSGIHRPGVLPRWGDGRRPRAPLRPRSKRGWPTGSA